MIHARVLGPREHLHFVPPGLPVSMQQVASERFLELEVVTPIRGDFETGDVVRFSRFSVFETLRSGQQVVVALEPDVGSVVEQIYRAPDPGLMYFETVEGGVRGTNGFVRVEPNGTVRRLALSRGPPPVPSFPVEWTVDSSRTAWENHVSNTKGLPDWAQEPPGQQPLLEAVDHWKRALAD